MENYKDPLLRFVNLIFGSLDVDGTDNQKDNDSRISAILKHTNLGGYCSYVSKFTVYFAVLWNR